MIGHKWEPAEGTIVNSHSEQMELPGVHGMHWVAVHEIDVRTQDGDQGRARVPSREYTSLHPGTVVRLEINAKTGEIRLHPHRDKLIIKLGFDYPGTGDGSATGQAPRPTVTFSGPAGADLAQFFGGAMAGGAAVVTGAEAADIVRTMRSGDPADVAAGRERLREIAQANRDAIQQAAAAGDPAARPRTDRQADTSDRPDPSDRVALLQRMLERGQLSQAEFDAKRQQILDQI
jgi:hypothetical protein